MRKPSEMYIALRMQNMVQIRAQNGVLYDQITFSLFLFLLCILRKTHQKQAPTALGPPLSNAE